jgi:hypothetical protein
MLLMIAFGVMNVWTMVGLAALIGVEKVWRHGEKAAKAAGLVSLVLAVVVLVSPSTAPGLDPGRIMNMSDTGMSETEMPETGMSGLGNEMTTNQGER